MKNLSLIIVAISAVLLCSAGRVADAQNANRKIYASSCGAVLDSDVYKAAVPMIPTLCKPFSITDTSSESVLK